MNEQLAHRITLDVSEETLERLTFLAAQEGVAVGEIASRLLANEAEAQADSLAARIFANTCTAKVADRRN